MSLKPIQELRTQEAVHPQTLVAAIAPRIRTFKVLQMLGKVEQIQKR